MDLPVGQGWQLRGQPRHGDGRVVLESASSKPATSMSAPIKAFADWWEFTEALHLFILFATTLGLVSAGVVTEFFEYFVYDMLRLRGYGWEFCG